MIILLSYTMVTYDFTFQVDDDPEQLRRRNNSVTQAPTPQPVVHHKHISSPSSAVTSHAPPSPRPAGTTPQDIPPPTPTPSPQQQTSSRKTKPKIFRCPASSDKCGKHFAYLGFFKNHIVKCGHISREKKKDIKSLIENEEKLEAFLQESKSSAPSHPRALGGLSPNGMLVPPEHASRAHTSVPGITYSIASPPLQAISFPAQASPQSTTSSFGNATSAYNNTNFNSMQNPPMTSHPGHVPYAGPSTAPHASGQFDPHGGMVDEMSWFDPEMNSNRLQQEYAPQMIRQFRS
jgi:hypothetical protein